MSDLQIKRDGRKIYCPLTDSYHIETPEEKVRQEYIIKLVNEYGYSLDQMAQEINVNNSQRGQGKARADIVVWRSKKDKDESKAAFIVVECKAENVRIREEDYYQGYNYASWAGASFFVTTNEKETKYFNVDKNYLPKELVEVVAIPTAEEALNDKKVKDILSRTKTFTRDEFTKVLRACHNIIRNNDKLSPEAAFDEISKILFMKIKYEREQRGTKVFTKKEFEEREKWFEKEIRPSLKGTPKDLPYMQFLFYNTKDEFKDDQLFEENEIIKIRQNSFEQILEKLESYNLSDTQDDVKGIAFEQFLGTTFRGELGQYFTPRTIVDFMTSILDPNEGETVCDPTCGSGGFLIKAFEYIREKIEDDVKEAKAKLRADIEGDNYEDLSEKKQLEINERIEKMQTVLNKELDTQIVDSRMYKLSRNCIYGTDANPRMARTSKMNMIMHGDGHGGVHHHDGLLNVNGIFEERFDVILTNPPFEDMETLIENTNDVEQLYELRDSLVSSDYAVDTLNEDFESLEDPQNAVVDEETAEVDWDQPILNELSDEIPYSEPEMVATENEIQEFIENENNPDELEALRDSLLSGEIAVETDESAEDDSPMVLTRDITPEIIESRERDTEETLDNYRDNLRDYGVSEEQIEEFVEQEREKINAEYESLDRGDTSNNIYYQPTNWEETADSLNAGQAEQLSEEASNELDIEQEVEQTNAELQEMNINYDEIYEGVQQEALEESFANVNIDLDSERLDTSLENFNASTWENLSLDEQKGSMEYLADYVTDVIGFDNPPNIEYYNNEQEGDFGCYDSSTNTLHINEYMLYNSDEAADTIAHELWHAHQYERANNPKNTRDYQYQYNFENYIPPELGQEAYESQLVEAEARAFATQFKDRLSMIKGRSI